MAHLALDVGIVAGLAIGATALNAWWVTGGLARSVGVAGHASLEYRTGCLCVCARGSTLSTCRLPTCCCCCCHRLPMRRWAWPFYWLAQGTMFWALFVVGHDW
jgi:hypothetical protein